MATLSSTNGKAPAPFPKLRKSNPRAENEDSLIIKKELLSSPKLSSSDSHSIHRKDRSPGRETNNTKSYSQVFIEKDNKKTLEMKPKSSKYQGSMKLQERSYSPSARDVSKMNEHQFIPGITIFKPKPLRSTEKIEDRLIQHGISTKLRKQEAATLVNYSFSPSVYSSAEHRDGDTFDYLFKQAEILSEEKRRKAQESFDTNYTFKPSINPNSKKLLKDKRYSTPQPGSVIHTESTAESPSVRGTHRRKLTPERLQAFLDRNLNPKLKQNSISQAEPFSEQIFSKSPLRNSISFEHDSMYERSIVLMKEKEVRIRYKAEMQSSENLRDCTFRPKISKPKPKPNRKIKQTQCLVFENEELKFRDYVKDILIKDIENFEERVAVFCDCLNK